MHNLSEVILATCARSKRVIPARTSGLLVALLALVMAVILPSGLASAAEVTVMQSSAPALKPGSSLRDNDRVTVPAGKSAILLMPSGATRAIRGPYDDTVATLTKGVRLDQQVYDSLKTLVSTGGASGATIGAMRSAAPKAGGAREGFSWRDVPITAQGDYCVERGATLALRRDGTGGAVKVTVVDMQSQARVQVSFAANDTTAPWPAELPPKIGTYAVLSPDQPLRQLRLRLISPLPGTEETAAVLLGQRCQTQLKAWISELTGR